MTPAAAARSGLAGAAVLLWMTAAAAQAPPWRRATRSRSPDDGADLWPPAGRGVQNVLAMVRRATEMAARIRKGARPADVPIEQPTRFDFIVNAKAAQALGITVPASLRLRADEVIE